MLNLQQPEMLWLMVPVIAAGIYLIRKGAKKGLIISRMVVLALLVIALASPYNVVSKISSSENPDLVLISDETASMELFEKQTATELYGSLAANTPTNVVKLTGESTALGDAIVQYARGDNQIVLVSDGNSNKGQDLGKALEFAKETGTTVYSVIPELQVNDVSLYISGEKTVVLNNEYQFDIIVQQAGDTPIAYQIEMYVDDQLVRSRTYDQEDDSRTIPVTYTFTSLGAHTITASITASDDRQPINNVFYKTVYVVPKPKIQVVTDDTGSPMADVLLNLYETSISTQLTDLDNKKAVVLDNRGIGSLSEAEIQNLQDYVSSGNGLYVVGGDSSYDYGNYLNSSLEGLLPVYSKATEWKGGRNVVLVLDVSMSTSAHGTHGDILGNAIHVLTKNNENLRGANVGVIAFGTEGLDVSGGLVYMGVPSNINRLEEQISSIAPAITSTTSLDQGLVIAQEWLAEGEGELDVIVISDGGIEQKYEESLKVASELTDAGVKLYYVHVKSSAPSQYDKSGNAFAKILMDEVGGLYFPVEKETGSIWSSMRWNSQILTNL